MLYDATTIINKINTIDSKYLAELENYIDSLCLKSKNKQNNVYDDIEEKLPNIRYATSDDTSWMKESWHMPGDGKPMTRDEMYDRF